MILSANDSVVKKVFVIAIIIVIFIINHVGYRVLSVGYWILIFTSKATKSLCVRRGLDLATTNDLRLKQTSKSPKNRP